MRRRRAPRGPDAAGAGRPGRSPVRLLVLTVPVVLVLALNNCETNRPDAASILSTDMDRPVRVILESRAGKLTTPQLVSGECAALTGVLPRPGQPVNPDLYQFVVFADAETGEEVRRIDMVTDPIYEGRNYVWDGETLADLRGEDPGPIWTLPGPDPCEYGYPEPDATTPATPGSGSSAPTPQST